MKYRIHKDRDNNKYIPIKQYTLWLQEGKVIVEENGDIVDEHEYTHNIRKADALRNIILKYHELAELPF